MLNLLKGLSVLLVIAVILAVGMSLLGVAVMALYTIALAALDLVYVIGPIIAVGIIVAIPWSIGKMLSNKNKTQTGEK